MITSSALPTDLRQSLTTSRMAASLRSRARRWLSSRTGLIGSTDMEALRREERGVAELWKESRRSRVEERMRQHWRVCYFTD